MSKYSLTYEINNLLLSEKIRRRVNKFKDISSIDDKIVEEIYNCDDESVFLLIRKLKAKKEAEEEAENKAEEEVKKKAEKEAEEEAKDQIFVNKGFDEKIYLAIYLYWKLFIETISLSRMGIIFKTVEIILIFFKNVIRGDYTNYYEEIFRKLLAKIIDEIIFNDEIRDSEKFEIVNKLKTWIRRTGQNDLSMPMMLENMIRSLSEYFNFFIEESSNNFDRAIKILEGLLNQLLYYKFSDISTKCCGCLIKMIKKTNMPEEIKNKYIEFLESQHLEKIIPKAFKLVVGIDKIAPNYENADINEEKAKKKAKELEEEHKDLLIDAQNDYYNKKINDELPIEPLLIMFCYRFLSSFQDYSAKMLFEKYNLLKPINHFISFQCVINKILKYPSEISYALLEIFQSIQSEDSNLIDYIFNPNIFEFQHRFLDEDWKSQYYKRIMRFPYKEVFWKGFWPKEKPYKEFKKSVKSLIDNTIIMKLPSTIGGITLKNKYLCIQDYESAKCKMGCTFYVILHEAAHKLQRVYCETYFDSHKPLSNRVEIDIEVNVKKDVLEEKIKKEIENSLKNLEECSKDYIDENKACYYKHIECDLILPSFNSITEESKLEEIGKKNLEDFEENVNKPDFEKEQISEERKIEDEASEEKIKKIDLTSLTPKAEEPFLKQNANIRIKEGGNEFEEFVFGRINRVINKGAAIFLLEAPKNITIEEFRNEFTKLNSRKLRLKEGTFQNLKTAGTQYLGMCSREFEIK